MFKNLREAFVAGVERGMDGFRQHGGTSSENRRDKLADRNRQIGRDGRVDYLLGSARCHISRTPGSRQRMACTISRYIRRMIECLSAKIILSSSGARWRILLCKYWRDRRRLLRYGHLARHGGRSRV